MNRSRLITQLGILIILLSLLPITAYAENNPSYEVSADVINVRSEPSIDANIVGKFTKGTSVKVFKEQYGWVQTYYNGQEVWIAKQYLISTNPNESSSTVSSSEKVVTILADGVNIRSGPGQNYIVVDSASTGNTFPVVQSEGEWHQIKLENGQKAWVASWLTDDNLSQQATEANTNVSSPIQSNGTLAGRHIVLDPGHGGHDPGAIGIQGTYEKNLTLSIAKNVVRSLNQAGATVTLTRDGDFFVPLERRAQISNNYRTDAFLSLHFNAFPILSAQGMSTYYYGNLGKEVAYEVQSALRDKVPLHSRGVIYSDFNVLRNTVAPAVLIELGFITNPHDYHVIQTNEYQEQVGQAITQGLINYFN